MLYPMLASSSELTSLENVFDNDNLVEEQKLDGDRNLIISPGGNYPPTVITRNGTPYTKRIPDSVRNLRFPYDKEAGSWILDGELVGGEFWVFDLLAAPGLDIGPHSPLYQRRAVLEAAFDGGAFPGLRLVPQAKTREVKIALAEVALRENFEGLMIKRADSTYISGGRTDAWLKLKFTATADVVVLGVREDGKEAVRLGLYNEHGIITDVGRSSLIGKEKNGTISKGDVIEVRYLYVGAGGRLFQPTILRKRTDKSAEECTFAQLKKVNKEVLVSL